VTRWTEHELATIGAADELQISTAKADGSWSADVPIWVVRAGDELFVRSYRGAEGGWFRRAVQRGHGRIQAGGLTRDVDFETATEEALAAAINAEYQGKYARYGPAYVAPMMAPQARAATLRLTPAPH
jgi:hypothetical protein